MMKKIEWKYQPDTSISAKAAILKMEKMLV
jgi:hypothetical protein